MPFISEEIWQALPKSPASAEEPLTIMRQPYPRVDKNRIDDKVEKEMKLLQQTIGAVRNIRGEMNIPQDKKAHVIARGPGKKLRLIEEHRLYLERLAGVEKLDLGEDIQKPPDAATCLVEDLEIFIPLGGLIDIDLEKERIGKEIERLDKLVRGMTLKLSNTEFIQKAPPDVVEKERQKQNDFQEKLKKLRENLSVLGS
jgi:valyl-tRNA synthetase